MVIVQIGWRFYVFFFFFSTANPIGIAGFTIKSLLW